MIEEILGRGVAAAEAFDDGAETDLFPAERALVARAVPARQREFATVRRCARLALGTLGIPPAPLLPGEARAPQWPAGVVGSMTHCDGYRAAAVARTSGGARTSGAVWTPAVRGVGIDAEPDAPLPDGVDRLIALPDEREHLAALFRLRADVHWDRLLFSCKESVYKTWFPLARRWLGFEDARIRIDPGTGVFTAELLVAGPEVDGATLRRLTGRWLARDGLLVTAITLTAARRGPPSGPVDQVLPRGPDARLEAAGGVEIAHDRADVPPAGTH